MGGARDSLEQELEAALDELYVSQMVNRDDGVYLKLRTQNRLLMGMCSTLLGLFKGPAPMIEVTGLAPGRYLVPDSTKERILAARTLLEELRASTTTTNGS